MRRKIWIITLLIQCAIIVIGITGAKIDGWDTSPNTQYHIQTDEGPERYFRYQTISGQYRKEKRLQDGTVIGSYGWVDADGYLRLNDYIADNDGYRILRTKRLYVGSQAPIDSALQAAKYVPPQAGVEVSSPSFKQSIPQSYPEDQSKYLQFPSTTLAPPLSSPSPSTVFPKRRPTPPLGYYPSSTAAPSAAVDGETVAITPHYYVPSKAYYKAPLYTSVVKTSRPEYNQNSISQPSYFGDKLYNRKAYDAESQYDGVSVTRNGFKYYLPRHYHEEQGTATNDRQGSFGYIDPFGIRRVVYYNASPGTGFVHRKNNRYVGFNATPYDP